MDAGRLAVCTAVSIKEKLASQAEKGKERVNRKTEPRALRRRYYFTAMILRGGSGDVIPGEQSETRNPGGIPTGKCLILLDTSFRWHDEIEPIRINAMDHYVAVPLKVN